MMVSNGRRVKVGVTGRIVLTVEPDMPVADIQFRIIDGTIPAFVGLSAIAENGMAIEVTVITEAGRVFLDAHDFRLPLEFAAMIAPMDSHRMMSAACDAGLKCVMKDPNGRTLAAVLVK